MLDYLFDTDPYPPRWLCGSWSSAEGWAHILSDLATAAAYLAIPTIVVLFMLRRRELPFDKLFWLFAAFIFSCGTVHLIEAIIFWQPVYRLSALFKIVTALVSLTTVVVLVQHLPRILAFPSLASINANLEREVRSRQQSEIELADSQRRLLAAQATGAIGDWSFNFANQRIEWSDQVYRLFERDPALGPPRDYEENRSAYTATGAERLDQLVAQVTDSKQQMAADLEAHLPSGRIVWHRGTITPTLDADGELIGLAGTVQDITQEKTQMILLQRQSEKLRRSKEDMEHFAYAASHDLQEPLRKIAFFSELLDEDNQDLDGESVDHLHRIRAATGRMQNLIDDLLRFSRTGRQELSTRAMDLGRLVADAAELHLVEADGRQFPATWPVVDVDAVLVGQLFGNLFNNASKYRHPERRLQLSVAWEHRGDRVVCQVSDNGIGFPPEQAEGILQPFTRLHSQEDYPGTGLGLATCKRIVEAHDGRLQAAGHIDTGATFTFDLPAAHSEERLEQ